MNPELRQAIDNAVNAMRTTQRLFQLRDGHILAQACKALEEANDKIETTITEVTLTEECRQILLRGAKMPVDEPHDRCPGDGQKKIQHKTTNER